MKIAILFLVYIWFASIGCYAKTEYIYQEYSNISTWNASIEANFPRAKVLWSSENPNIFISLVTWMSGYYICVYAKDPSRYTEISRKTQNWKVVAAHQNKDKELAPEMVVYYYAGIDSQKWVKKKMFMGRRLGSFQNYTGRIAVRFDDLGLILSVNPKNEDVQAEWLGPLGNEING